MQSADKSKKLAFFIPIGAKSADSRDRNSGHFPRRAATMESSPLKGIRAGLGYLNQIVPACVGHDIRSKNCLLRAGRPAFNERTAGDLGKLGRATRGCTIRAASTTTRPGSQMTKQPNDRAAERPGRQSTGLRGETGNRQAENGIRYLRRPGYDRHLWER